jgi:hypothetical protein
MRLLAPLSVVLAMLAGGCAHNEYQLELRPDGESIERKLTLWRVDGDKIGPFPPEQLQAIAKLYPQRLTPADAQKHAFVGRFGPSLPDDVGGAGSYTYLASSLGDSYAYVERFRGDDDVEQQLQARRQAAQRLSELVLGWCQQQLGREPGFDMLRQFLENDFRRDLANVAIYAWLGDMAPSKDGQRAEPSPSGDAEMAVRVAQYLIERGYVTLSQMPRLYRAIATQDDDALGEIVARFVAGKMGHPADRPLPQALRIFTKPGELKESWQKYLAATPEYQAHLEQWRAQNRDNPEPPHPPQPDEVLGELAMNGVLGLRLFQTSDELTLRLYCGRQPYSTNGQWLDREGCVEWSDQIIDKPFPVLCYATWSAPNERFQIARFGRVVLRDEDLTAYCLWLKSLTRDETEHWEKFLASLEPGPAGIARLKEFRFAAERRPGATDSRLSDLVRDRILEKLDPQPVEAPQACQ